MWPNLWIDYCAYAGVVAAIRVKYVHMSTLPVCQFALTSYEVSYFKQPLERKSWKKSSSACFFQGLNYDFMVYKPIYFTHNAASSTVTDDVEYEVMHRIFNTKY